MKPTTGTGKYEKLLASCRNLEPVATAVAHPCEKTALEGAVDAAEAGLIRPILVGPADKIRDIARQNAIPLDQIRIVDAPHSHASAAKAVELVRQGEAEILMKGSLHTDELLGAVVARETGLAHRAPHQPCVHHGRADLSQGAHRHRRRRSTSHRPWKTKSTSARTPSTSRFRLASKSPKVAILAAVETVTFEDAGDAGCGRPLQDGRTGTNQRRYSRRAAGVRQRHQHSEAARDQRNSFGSRRRSGHPPRPGSRIRQHSRQAAQLSCQCGQRGSGPRRAGAGHSDQPGRQRAIADRELRGGDVGSAQAQRQASHEGARDSHGRLCACSQRRLIEPEVLRLSATGSSRVAAGSARTNRRDRHVPRDCLPRTMPERASATRCWAASPMAATAFDALAGVAPIELRGRRGVLGVGHRVVHGGARLHVPTVVTPEVLADLRELVPLAPLHQPYNLAAIDAVLGAAARRAAGRLLRHELSSRPAGRCRTGPAAARALSRQACSATGFTAFLRIHRFGAAGGGARNRRTGA